MQLYALLPNAGSQGQKEALSQSLVAKINTYPLPQELLDAGRQIGPTAAFSAKLDRLKGAIVDFGAEEMSKITGTTISD